MEISYTKVGDYLLPNIALSDPPDAPPLGYYGMRRKAFLREHRPIMYSRLLLSEQLFPHCREVDEAAVSRRKCGCSEEVILSELVYD
jgi:hypothetical protein